ncbi:MAG: hypothetical protein ACOY3M_01925 [Patescibacteria group bacterium]
MRRARAEHPKDNYIIVTAVYPEKPGAFLEIQRRPLSTGELLVSVPMPQGTDRDSLRKAWNNFNIAGMHVGRSAQLPFFEALESLVPGLSEHRGVLFDTTG